MTARPDLAKFGYESVSDRVTLFSWWEAVGSKIFVDLVWEPTKADSRFIANLSTGDIIEKFPDALVSWLKGQWPSLLGKGDLPSVLTHSLFQDQRCQLNLPEFLKVIWRSREDLQLHHNIASLIGGMSFLDWWETDGQAEYPRIEWTPDDQTYSSILLLQEINVSGIVGQLPKFLSLIILERVDLQIHSLNSLSGFLCAIRWWDQHGRLEYSQISWRSRRSTFDFLLQLNPAAVPSSLLLLPRFFRPLLMERADLAASHPYDTFLGAMGAVNWWDEDGYKEYPELRWVASPSTYSLLNEIRLHHFVGCVQLPGFFPLLFSKRPDLAGSYNLNTLVGIFGAIDWWVQYGELEYPKLHWMPDCNTFAAMTKLEDTRQAALLLPLPKFFGKLFDERKDLSGAFDLNEFSGRLHAIDWWQSHGSSQYRHLNWRPDLSTFNSCIKTRPLELDVPTVGSLPALLDHAQVPAFLIEIVNSRGDLSTHFDLKTVSGIEAAVHWWQTFGKTEYPALNRMNVKALSPSIAPRASGSSEGKNSRLNWTITEDDDFARLPSGVNIIGYPQGILGLGEDARMAVACFTAAQIPNVPINATVPGPKRVLSVPSLGSSPKYSTSLFCLPPFEMMRLAMEGGKWLINFEAYKIGAWPWELPYWPVAFSGIYQFVDEIWAQSRFVEAVFQDNGQTKVRHMPMAVEVPTPTEDVRTRFNLPEKDFLFYSLFDGASWLTRKNPLGSVLAFRKAFGADPVAHGGVGLVIKAMNVNTADKQWLEICRIAATDSRIKIINKQLDKVEAVNVMNSCDAYISLHRSEGFGRVLAESMLLKKPVVATNFSGNVDFCNADTAYLVDGPLVPLAKGDYLMYEGQYWCDPDIDIASSQLQAVVNDASRRLQIAEAGQLFIMQNYSRERTGSRYSARLSEIRTERER